METQRKQQKPQRNQQLETKWENIRASYRNKYPTLTEEDITYGDGEFDDMTERVARRTNRSRDQVLNEIRDWEERDYKEEYE